MSLSFSLSVSDSRSSTTDQDDLRSCLCSSLEEQVLTSTHDAAHVLHCPQRHLLQREGSSSDRCKERQSDLTQPPQQKQLHPVSTAVRFLFKRGCNFVSGLVEKYGTFPGMETAQARHVCSSAPDSPRAAERISINFIPVNFIERCRHIPISVKIGHL
jgi:hypothetical protein